MLNLTGNTRMRIDLYFVFLDRQWAKGERSYARLRLLLMQRHGVPAKYTRFILNRWFSLRGMFQDGYGQKLPEPHIKKELKAVKDKWE